MEEILGRDDAGREVIEGLLGDERTGYAVASTVVSKMRYFSSVAGLWQRSERRLSIREWLTTSSVLLVGSNETARASLDGLNEQIFKVLVEEIDMQANSSSRRTWIWLDECRLSGGMLKHLPFVCVKGRSRGAAIAISFQDVDGFREACGSPRIANEIIAQCSNKALLRLEGDETASLASKLLGQFETIEVFQSDNSSGMSRNVSEQRVVKDSVLASEFYNIPVTNRENGLTGYFITPTSGAYRGTVPSADIGQVVVGDEQERRHAIQYRPETDQWLRHWTAKDRERLSLERLVELNVPGPSRAAPMKRKKLRLRRGENIEDLRLPTN